MMREQVTITIHEKGAFGIFSRAADRLRRYCSGMTFGVLMLVLLTMEVLCVILSYYTAGEIFQIFVGMLMAFNIVPLGLYVSGRRVLALVTATILAGAVIPPQVVDGIALMRVHEEAARMVAYIYEIRVRTGSFPAALAGYSFRYPGLAGVIHYSPGAGGDPFSVAYHVPGCTSDYWYRPGEGWMYYPD